MLNLTEVCSRESRLDIDFLKIISFENSDFWKLLRLPINPILSEYDTSDSSSFFLLKSSEFSLAVSGVSTVATVFLTTSGVVVGVGFGAKGCFFMAATALIYNLLSWPN